MGKIFLNAFTEAFSFFLRQQKSSSGHWFANSIKVYIIPLEKLQSYTWSKSMTLTFPRCATSVLTPGKRQGQKGNFCCMFCVVWTCFSLLDPKMEGEITSCEACWLVGSTVVFGLQCLFTQGLQGIEQDGEIVSFSTAAKQVEEEKGFQGYGLPMSPHILDKHKPLIKGK